MNAWFVDYFLLEGLLQKTGKRTLDSLLYRELGVSGERITDAERVRSLYSLHESGDLVRQIEERNL